MIDALGPLNRRRRFTSHCCMLRDSVAQSKSAGYGQRPKGRLFEWQGIMVLHLRRDACFGVAEGRLRLHWQPSLVVQHLYPVPCWRRIGRNGIKGGANTQYPVAGQAEEPFRLCVFHL